MKPVDVKSNIHKDYMLNGKAAIVLLTVGLIKKTVYK